MILDRFAQLRSLLRKKLATFSMFFKTLLPDWNRGMIENVFCGSLRYGDSMRLQLTIDHIAIWAKPVTIFLEARRSMLAGLKEQTTKLVVTTQTKDHIYTSVDNGKTWANEYFQTPIAGRIKCSFTLDSGERLIYTQNKMHHFDPSGKLLAVHTTGRWPWHGSQGIGQSVSGAVLYAEYAIIKNKNDMPVIHHVWRYRPQEGSWNAVFSIDASYCRHFHVCRPNPANPEQWVLSSGDLASQCRLWTSEDDGDSWVEIDAARVTITEIPGESRRQVFRFTQFSALSNGDLIWGTDDLLGVGCSALIRMSQASGEPVFHFLGWLGDNCIRNIIACGDDRFILVSESKSETMSTDVFLYDHNAGEISRLTVPNLNHQKCSVTDSLGSSYFIDGYAFVPAFGNIFLDRWGLLRIHIDGPHPVE